MPSGDGGTGPQSRVVSIRQDDDAQIRAVITRYFLALDRRDYASLAACFAPDATAWYDREYGPGREAIVAYLSGAMARWDATTHLGGNPEIVIGEGAARAHISAVAYLVSDLPVGAGARIRVRGLRYTDTFTDDAGGWVISRRERVADWSFDVDGQHLGGVDSVPSPSGPRR